MGTHSQVLASRTCFIQTRTFFWKALLTEHLWFIPPGWLCIVQIHKMCNSSESIRGTWRQSVDRTLLYIFCWLVVWNIFYFPFHIWDNSSHWRTHIFQDGYCTTNQVNIFAVYRLLMVINHYEPLLTSINHYYYPISFCIHWLVHMSSANSGVSTADGRSVALPVKPWDATVKPIYNTQKDRKTESFWNHDKSIYFNIYIHIIDIYINHFSILF